MPKIWLIVATILSPFLAGCGNRGGGDYTPNPARDAMVLQLMSNHAQMPVYQPPAFQPVYQPMRLQTICNRQGGFTYCN